MIERNYVLVIIPTYNRKSMITDAINSVLTQDYPYFRMVIVDDGSTDNTKKLCEEIVSKNPERIIYQLKENGGCSSARNKGLEFISDDVGYVCFLDSDDRLLPGKLSREVNLLRNNPSASFSYADSIVYDEVKNHESLYRVAAAGRPKDFAIEHFQSNEAKCSALLYKAEIFVNKRFREDLRYNEDSEFLQRIAIEYNGVYCAIPGCWVRFHSGSKSRNFLEINKAVLKSSQGILDLYPEFYKCYKEQIDGTILRIRKTLFKQLILNKHWEEAKLYANNLGEKILVASRLKVYYQMRQALGRILRQ